MSAVLGEKALAAAAGGFLFYPCSGRDWDELVGAFSPAVDTFWFCDPCYDESCAAPVRGFRIVETTIDGDPTAALRQVRDENRAYRHVPRCVWTSRMVREEDGTVVTVNRRRGFGKYALATEFSTRSISVFVHRGDTLAQGEGSSGSCFLARRRRRRDHEPLSMLFDKLARKLRDTAMVVSDGSNTDIAELKRFRRYGRDGTDAFAAAREEPFTKWGFDWRCVGHLGPRYGPTLVWETRRRPSG